QRPAWITMKQTTKRDRIRRFLFERPGATAREIIAYLGDGYTSPHVLRAELCNLRRRGDLVIIYHQYYPSPELIRRGPVRPRARRPVVERLEDGRVRVFDKRITVERARLLVERLAQAIDYAE
ncbi:MAG TPA: hypothetical protein VIT93_00635, partial [Dehalococcoidia bacterium]